MVPSTNLTLRIRLGICEWLGSVLAFFDALRTNRNLVPRTVPCVITRRFSLPQTDYCEGAFDPIRGANAIPVCGGAVEEDHQVESLPRAKYWVTDSQLGNAIRSETQQHFHSWEFTLAMIINNAGEFLESSVVADVKISKH
ncbi:MAG: hypothetical protein MK102_01645 [Fuerstiella sp.]|nr:hypothetical protein [Fuerstiella sp.]